MLNLSDINQIVRDATARNFGPKIVEMIDTQLTIDSEGHDALHIRIALAPGVATKLTGDAALDTLVEIQDRLRDAGDERFPILEYGTEDELFASDSSES
jgi:hypothetical protein